MNPTPIRATKIAPPPLPLPAPPPAVRVAPPGVDAAPLTIPTVPDDGLVNTVMILVCRHFGVVPDRIRSSARLERIISARRCIDRILADFGFSTPEIAGRVYGIRGHTAVIDRLSSELTYAQREVIGKVKAHIERTRWCDPVDPMNGERSLTDNILQTVSKVMGISVPLIRSARRTKAVVRSRAIAAWLLYRRGNHSLEEVGEVVRVVSPDHTTVMNYLAMVERQPDLLKIAQRIERDILKEAA